MRNTITYKGKSYEILSAPGSVFGDIKKCIGAYKLTLSNRPREALDKSVRVYETSGLNAVFRDDVAEDEFERRVNEYNSRFNGSS